MDSATIVAASLDSSKLEQSINELVSTVAAKTKEMADNFTSEVKRMEDAVKNLGSIKIDSCGVADSGSSRRTSSLKQEEQQVKSVATSYDGLAKAQQTAIGSRGGSALRKDIDEAANSYSGLIQQIERTQAKFDISPIQNLRMRQHELEAGMQTAANEAAKAKKDVDELNAAISNYRKTLETLPKDQQGFANRQAIQKEINDLITLRDASVLEQQKWTNAGKTLAAQYESVKGEIRQIGQTLIDSEKAEKQVTSELDKQLQKIKEINSSKNAKAVYESISAMPNNTIEQANLKLQALQALKEKVASTPLLSKSSQSQLTQAITDTKLRIEQLENSVRGANQSKKSLDELNAAVTQNIRREEERRNAILQTGIAAQEAFAKIRQSTQIQLADNTDKPIMGVKELTDAIRNMERTYWGMDAANRESPLGQSLKRDIENAQKLRISIEAYNKTLTGLPVIQGKTGVDKTLGSYTELSNILKRLSDEYRRLGREERNAAKGDDLANKIQRLSRETQKIQQQMSRPISFAAALKGDEKTLDDIAYKIRRLQSYKLGIDITKPNAANEIKQVDEAILRLQKDMDKYLGKSKDILASNNALGRSWNYMKNRLAFYFTIGASTQFVRNLIDIRSQYEMNEKALGILIDSAERGTQIFNELSEMALVSPYTLIELSAAAKQLTAYDIAAKDVVDTTRRLADMASAVGVPIDRLTYALGQIKAYGYLNSRDARMFANAGIPLVRELSKYYTELEGKVVSVGDVYDRMKKKAIDYNSVMAVVTKMTDEGGKFFDFQAKMADTLKVQLANLTLAWNNMLNEIGSSEQGVLTGGISALKNLFLHWQDIESAIKKVVVAFGLFKMAQFTALAFVGDLTSAMAWQTLVGKKLQTTFASMATGIKASSLAIGAAGAAFWLLLAEGIVTYTRNAEEIERLNKSIAEGAKESAKTISDFVNSAEMSYARLSAQTGKLPKTDAQKTWEAVREQIELSAISSENIIPKLLQIEDLNTRLTTAFDLAERIGEANEKLSDLENSLTISQDSILGGLLGEGIIEDIEDYNEHLTYSAETAEYFTKENNGFWQNTAMGLKGFIDSIKESLGSSTDEAEIEIKEFATKAAQTIKDELGEEGMRDSIQVNEAIARVLQGVEQMFPQLRGKGKILFETMFNDVMAQEFNGAVDKQAYYYKLFLERLKKDHASAFQDVTDNILKETHHWSNGQINAIEKTAERVKKDLPAASQSAIDEILRQLNSTDFKIRIVTQFATTTLDDVQKRFRERFIELDNLGNSLSEKDQTERMQKYGTLMIKNNESDLEYQERIRKEKQKQLDISKAEGEIIENNKGKTDNASKAITARATEAKKAADETLKAIGEIQNWGGYDFATKKEDAAAKKAQKAAESELQKALKEELSIIDKIRSNYQALTREGMNHADAIKASTAGYEKSARAISQTLTRFGLQAFDPSAFAGISDPNDLVRLLQGQLDKLIKSGKAKPAEIKDLEIKVNDVKLDAEKYNLTRITKGLNNELDKLKDEYELAVELDANPELGDMFADMFGINTSTLPQTFGEALDRAQEIINRKLSDINIASPFDLMQSDVNEFANSSGLEKESEAIKELAKWQNTFRDMFKKNLLDSEKMLDDYVKKYGGYSDKIAEIEADRLEKIKKLNDAYYTEEMRQRPEYIAKMNAINQGASREKSNVEFDAFKNSRYYTMMFENLDYISTKTIRDMRDRLRELMNSMKDLTPEQLKQVMTQYEKLEQKLVKRSPFKTLTKDLKNYLKTSGDRKAANEAFRNAQKEYDAQEKSVAALKEKYEQAKANNNTSQSYLDFLKIEIDGENEVLQILKEQLKVAEEKADKYNLIKKLALEELSQTATMVAANLKGLAELRDQMNELFGVDASKGETLLGHNIDGMIDSLAKAGDGISKITSSAQSGNAFGVVGGVVDVFTGVGDAIASIFGDGAARTRRLNREINESKETVRQLSMAYDDLERAVNKSLGTAETEARRAAIANKELQLTELERQKTLEESKRSKDRDDDAIKQYEESIHSIKNEIADLKEEVVNNLWGEDVKSAAEAFVDTWVQAWRAGETTLDAIQEKMDDMILNLIKKAMTSKIVETLLNPLYSELDRMTKEGSEGGMALTINELRQLATQAGVTAEEINTALGAFYGNLANLGIISPTEESKELSALQQGIQGITEDTAGALEAYMNGVSQQVYLQSDLLTQIRDAVVGFNLDVQVATMSQILSQLQSSYTVHLAIKGILEGWSSPSGLAVRVEMQ